MRRKSAAQIMGPLLFVLSLTAGGLVSDRPARAERAGTDVIGALERNARRLAGTYLGGQRFEAIRGRRQTISLRPERGVISVERTFSRKGYFLDQHGRLSAADRAALARDIARGNPGATSKDVLATLRGSLGQHRARQRELRQADPTIDGLLSQISALPAGDRRAEITLWRGARGTLSYRPQTRVIVGSAGLSSEGFFFKAPRAGETPALRDDSLQSLRAFITDRR